MEATVNLDALIGRYAAFPFDDNTPLPAAGIESLTVLRLAVEVAADENAEIDGSGLVGMHTVRDLKRWLIAIASEQGAGRIAGTDAA